MLRLWLRLLSCATQLEAEIRKRLRERLPANAKLVVMSDHGFAPYRRKFSLNTWRLEQGYLVLKPGERVRLWLLDGENPAGSRKKLTGTIESTSHGTIELRPPR